MLQHVWNIQTIQNPTWPWKLLISFLAVYSELKGPSCSWNLIKQWLSVVLEITKSCAAVLTFVLFLITSCMDRSIATPTFCRVLHNLLCGSFLETKYIFCYWTFEHTDSILNFNNVNSLCCTMGTTYYEVLRHTKRQKKRSQHKI